MLLIAGLGNPDEEYLKTRHNIGYRIIIALCEKLGHDFLKTAQTYRANQFLKMKAGEQDVVFCLPLGYMNNSGNALKQLMDFFGDNTTKDLWVVHDDTEIPFGTVKIKYGGTSGGHNGIKSIDEAIGEKYWRIRVGVGRPASKEHDLADYVLAGFPKAEQALLPTIIDQTVATLVKSIEEGKLETKTFNAKKDINQST
ncbi:MAG TPA: aminoacyl-tRNA hydrolase [Candidatus Saccharimonadales bacterium]|nr:aminoacyl-tRNA hydrolase [Candidatus Saccharimonadales bacterium]